jgi:hypothetical protein
MPKLRPFQVEDGYTTLLDLTDTPSDYTGLSTKILKVNATEDGLEFVENVGGDGGSDGYKDISEIYADTVGGSVDTFSYFLAVTGITGNTFTPSQTGFYTLLLKAQWTDVGGGESMRFRLGVSDGYVGNTTGELEERGNFMGFGIGATSKAALTNSEPNPLHTYSLYMIAGSTYSFELQAANPGGNGQINTNHGIILYALGPWSSTGKGQWPIYERRLSSAQSTTSSTWTDIEPATLGGYMTPTESGKYMFLMQGAVEATSNDAAAQFRLDINGDSYGGDNPEHTAWVESDPINEELFTMVYTADLIANTLHTIRAQFRRSSGSGTISSPNDAGTGYQLAAFGPLTEYTKVFDSFPSQAISTTGSWADMDAYLEGYFTPEQTATYCFLLKGATGNSAVAIARGSFRLDVDGDAYGGDAGYQIVRQRYGTPVPVFESFTLPYMALLEADTQYLIKTQWKDTAGVLDAGSETGFALHAFGPFNEII